MKFKIISKHSDAETYDRLFKEELTKHPAIGSVDKTFNVVITDKVLTKKDVDRESRDTFFIHTAKKENTLSKKRKLVKDIIADAITS